MNTYYLSIPVGAHAKMTKKVSPINGIAPDGALPSSTVTITAVQRASLSHLKTATGLARVIVWITHAMQRR